MSGGGGHVVVTRNHSWNPMDQWKSDAPPPPRALTRNEYFALITDALHAAAARLPPPSRAFSTASSNASHYTAGGGRCWPLVP